MEQDVQTRLMEWGVENVLIADDTKENLRAAKEYFDSLKKLRTEYVNNGEEAIKQIIERSKSEKNPLHLVLTDLQMETPKKGLEVFEAGYSYLTPIAIVTGGLGHHGAGNVCIYPCGRASESKFLAGSKSEPRIWQEALEAITSEGNHTRETYRAMLAAKKYSAIPLPCDIAQMIVKSQVKFFESSVPRYGHGHSHSH